MHRTPLLKALQRYLQTASCPTQQQYAKNMLAFVQREPNCLKRSCLEGHLTGSAWLLNTTGNKALLMHHRKLQLWLQPGGHADGEPDLLQVALREATEESGLTDIEAVTPDIFDLDIHRVPAYQQEPEHLHFDVRYLLQAKGSDAFQPNHESLGMGWFSVADFQDPSFTLDRSVARLAQRWANEVEQAAMAPSIELPQECH